MFLPKRIVPCTCTKRRVLNSCVSRVFHPVNFVEFEQEGLMPGVEVIGKFEEKDRCSCKMTILEAAEMNTCGYTKA